MSYTLETIAPVLSLPLEALIFAIVLASIAIAHTRALEIAAAGLLSLVALKLCVTGFRDGAGFDGLVTHFRHEAVGLVNLGLLLLGFALLARHFAVSRLADALPTILPPGRTGAFVLLGLVFALSAVLDNIAAALIGTQMARSVFGGRVHIGYLAAIVAASNAGGAGSVVGDTTTTMLWISGVAPGEVLRAYLAAFPALLVTGFFAASQQDRLAPIKLRADATGPLAVRPLAAVAITLAVTVGANVICNLRAPAVAEHWPVVGTALWAGLLVTVPLSRPDWTILKSSLSGAAFLLMLVAAASLVPVDRLPPPSAVSTFALGLVSAVFDNIPLTALAIKQGGYDWGALAFAVGFGGSMLWFGSSAGVAVASLHPEARSALAWVKAGWHVTVAYVAGFAVMMFLRAL